MHALRVHSEREIEIRRHDQRGASILGQEAEPLRERQTLLPRQRPVTQQHGEPTSVRGTSGPSALQAPGDLGLAERCPVGDLDHARRLQPPKKRTPLTQAQALRAAALSRACSPVWHETCRPGDMGRQVERETFSDEERQTFAAKLAESLDALEVVLERPGFGLGPITIGAEVELDLVDETAQPMPVAHEVLESLDPSVFTTEMNRFNLEFNAPPLPLAGRPFEALRGQLDGALASVRRAAAPYGALPISVGILPTLEERHLSGAMITDKHRYRALSNAVRAAAEAPFTLHIRGQDALFTRMQDVTAEGANTSFQVHLRCNPDEFARTYNATQLVTAPIVAASANSPIFLGRVLWDETRIALFRQAVDDRPGPTADDWRPSRVSFGHGWTRRGFHELMAESVAMHAPLLPLLSDEDPLSVVRSGEVPKLPELRLHQGTVWRWNRAIYDPAAGGHVRIEMRAMASGPTPVDMAANAALAIGATLAMRGDEERWVPCFTFGQARRNFYEAARAGLDAELLWPRRCARPELRPAADIVLELCDRAEGALIEAGVEGTDARAALDVVRTRVRRRLNGAAWQRRSFGAIMTDMSCRTEASQRLTRSYLTNAEAGIPVHEWPLGTA